jgi:hypothetical protein
MVVSSLSKVAPFSRPAESTGLQAELSAMEAIAVALAQLADEETRARVLHWAGERFCRSIPVVITLQAPSARADALQLPSNPAQAADDGLSVSALGELFGPDEPHRDQPQSVPGVLREFVADFQNIVHEWNVACSEPAVTPFHQRVSSG